MSASNANLVAESGVAISSVAAGLGLVVVGGVYADGYAHVNIGGLETFFTPWHAALYGSFAVLAGWILGSIWLGHRRLQVSWRDAVPVGYGWGLVGIGSFAVGGVGDMAWHLAFGIEAGIDALTSPTHLILLAGGVLLLSSPLRAALARGQRTLPWSAVLSVAAVVALVAFFLSYVSVFTDPGSVTPLTHIPEGAPGHQAAELPAVAGLGGYLVTTLLLVVPVIYLRRTGRLLAGGVLAVVAAASVPPAVLGQLEYVVPLVGALLGAAVVDLWLRDRSASVLAAVLPGAVWAGQLIGLAGIGQLGWPMELWAGVTVLTMLLGYGLERLTLPRGALAATPATPAS